MIRIWREDEGRFSPDADFGDIRPEDLRKLYLLIGEALAQGSDPVLWRCQVLDGIRGLMGGTRSAASDWLIPEGGRPVRISFLERGGESGGGRTSEDGTPGIGPDEDPWPPVSSRRVSREGRFRCGLETSEVRFRLVRGRSGTGRPVAVVVQGRKGRFGLEIVVAGRAPGNSFGPEDGLLGALMMREILPHLGRRLAMCTQPSITHLPPRQREVLQLLLLGGSEKEIADRMDLSAHTVHDYIKGIYRKFKVRSRGELFAHFLKALPLFQGVFEGRAGSGGVRDGLGGPDSRPSVSDWSLEEMIS